MRTINIDIGSASGWVTICAGRRGEKETTQVVFDISSLIETYGAGTAVFFNKRNTDETAYPVVVDQSGNLVTWTVSDTDTNVVGSGRCELWYYVGESLAKTLVFQTYIAEDIGVPGAPPPEPFENWVEQLTELGAETLANAQAAEDAKDDAIEAKEAAEAAAHSIVDLTVSSETLPAGSSATVTKTESGGVYNLDFGIPKGDKGDKGDTGATGATPDIYTTATTLPAGSTAYAHVSGTIEQPLITFGIPKGDKGDKGDTGTAATVSVGTTTTGAAGSSASVTNSGSTSAAVFNFTIPKGDTGATGADGADGISPEVTIGTITGGHSVTITDADHPTGQTFNVLDGTNTDAEHVTYDSTQTFSTGTVGNALNQLNSDLNSALKSVNEVFNLDEWTPIQTKQVGSGYIKATDGTVASGNNTYYTDYVEVGMYESIKYQMILTTSNVYTFTIGIAFYNDGKEYVSGFKARGGQSNAGYQEDIVSVPVGSKYARFSLWKDTSYGTFYAYGVSSLYKASSVEDYFVVNKNLFDKSQVTQGVFVVTNSGGTSSNSTTFASDYIPVRRGNTYSYRVAYSLYGDTAAKRLALYDANKTFIDYTTGTASDNIITVKIPNNKDAYSTKGIPAYCRFSDYINRIDSTMFVDGSYPSDYYKYGKNILVESFGLNNRQIQEVSDAVSVGVLYGKKIAYNGDSIAESRLQDTNAFNGGAYAKLIADETGGTYANSAVSGGILASAVPSGTMPHSVVNTLENMPDDADLICFEGGINDYWRDVPLGDYVENDYSSTPDTTTVCGALESIIKQATTKWVGKPICFVIVHKITSTVYAENSVGYTFAQAREKMLGICKKWAIPVYDAFAESGLNAYNSVQNTNFLTSNSSGTPDGCHPNEAGYQKYYVPQLLALFESIMPRA